MSFVLHRLKMGVQCCMARDLRDFVDLGKIDNLSASLLFRLLLFHLACPGFSGFFRSLQDFSVFSRSLRYKPLSIAMVEISDAVTESPSTLLVVTLEGVAYVPHEGRHSLSLSPSLSLSLSLSVSLSALLLFLWRATKYNNFPDETQPTYQLYFYVKPFRNTLMSLVRQ